MNDDTKLGYMSDPHDEVNPGPDAAIMFTSRPVSADVLPSPQMGERKAK